MPGTIRSRRFKPILILVVLFTLTVLYITSSARTTRNSDFYQRTQAALQDQRNRAQDHAAAKAADGIGSDEGVAKRLKDAEEQAKAAADRKGELHRAQLGMEELPEEAEDEEKSVAGRKTMKADATAKPDDSELAEPAAKAQAPVKGQQTAETEEEHKVEQELNTILKRSPSE